MNTKETITRLRRITARLERDLDLGWLTIRHRYDESAYEDRVVAETTADWEYRQASIKWSLPAVNNIGDEELEATAIHEYVHILLNPITGILPSRQGVDKLDEFTTECLTRAIVAARKAQ